MFAAWLMFGVLGVPIQQEFGLTDVQLSWLSAMAILNGSLWHPPAGILADRFGGRRVFAVLLVATAVFAYGVSLAHSYGLLLVLAFLVGFAGNSFNVGASVTKFNGPGLIAATAGTTVLGVVEGGWRLIPVIYAVVLLAVAVLVWMLAPRRDRTPGRGRTLRQELVPLRQARVWRLCRQSATGQFSSVRSSPRSMSGVGSVR
jgi:NNP family nitrate/nitrite transporter-like MFS transporter